MEILNKDQIKEVHGGILAEGGTLLDVASKLLVPIMWVTTNKASDRKYVCPGRATVAVAWAAGIVAIVAVVWNFADDLFTLNKTKQLW